MYARTRNTNLLPGLCRTLLLASLGVVLLPAGCEVNNGAEKSARRQEQIQSDITPPADAAASSQQLPEADGPEILPDTHLAAGRLHESQGQLGRAVDQYRQVIAMAPRKVEAYNRLGIVLDQLGRFREADEAFLRGIKIAPHQAHLRNNLAFSYILQGRWKDAETTLVDALTQKPDFMRARINLGMVLAQQNRFEESLREFAFALPRADAYYNLGLMYQSRHKLPEAARAFQAALDNNPKLVAAHKRLEMLPHEVVEAAQAVVLPSDRPAVAPTPPADEQAVASAGLSTGQAADAHVDAQVALEPATPLTDAPGAAQDAEPAQAVAAAETEVSIPKTAHEPSPAEMDAPIQAADAADAGQGADSPDQEPTTGDGETAGDTSARETAIESPSAPDDASEPQADSSEPVTEPGPEQSGDETIQQPETTVDPAESMDANTDMLPESGNDAKTEVAGEVAMQDAAAGDPAVPFGSELQHDADPDLAAFEDAMVSLDDASAADAAELAAENVEWSPLAFEETEDLSLLIETPASVRLDPEFAGVASQAPPAESDAIAEPALEVNNNPPATAPAGEGEANVSTAPAAEAQAASPAPEPQTAAAPLPEASDPPATSPAP